MSTAASIGAAQRVRVNIEDISQTLDREEEALNELSASPLLEGAPLQRIQGIVRATGERIAVLKKTGLASGETGEIVDGLSGVQRDLMKRISKADSRTKVLERALSRSNRGYLHLTASTVPHAGTALKNFQGSIRAVGEEIAALRGIFPTLNQGAGLLKSLACLDRLGTEQVRQAKLITDRIEANHRVSMLSVPKREDLRLPAVIHARIGSFIGPHYRVCNTYSRDDIRNPRHNRPDRNAFEEAVFAEADVAVCIQAFDSLKGKEAELMRHFLDMTTRREGTHIREPRDRLVEHFYDVACLSLEARMVEQFHKAIRGLEFVPFNIRKREAQITQVKRAHWDMLVRGPTRYEKETGEEAQKRIQDAIWIVRGCTTDVGNMISPMSINFTNTVGAFDAAAQIACHRLANNHLKLLATVKDRDAILSFVWDIHNKTVTKEDIHTSFRKLKENSLDAARLLAYAVANAFRVDRKNGQEFILGDVTPEQAKIIYAVAGALSTFENGNRKPETIRGAASADPSKNEEF